MIQFLGDIYPLDWEKTRKKLMRPDIVSGHTDSEVVIHYLFDYVIKNNGDFVRGLVKGLEDILWNGDWYVANFALAGRDTLAIFSAVDYQPLIRDGKNPPFSETDLWEYGTLWKIPFWWEAGAPPQSYVFASEQLPYPYPDRSGWTLMDFGTLHVYRVDGSYEAIPIISQHPPADSTYAPMSVR